MEEIPARLWREQLGIGRKKRADHARALEEAAEKPPAKAKEARSRPDEARHEGKGKNSCPPPYAAETKDVRFAGTFEVLVPVPERNKPHKVPLQFPSLEAANWMHSPEGKETIAEILEAHQDK